MIKPIEIGDRVTGRDVTSGQEVTGAVSAILYPFGPGWYTDRPHDHQPEARRYRLLGGAIVECAERAR